MYIIAVLYYISSVIILFCSFVVEKCKKEKVINENYKVAKVSKYLTTKEKQCLAILGAWGVGKTYFWKQVEKENTLKFSNKKIIYIDLFGKENYKQILEEIILKLHGNYNKIINIFAQITFRIAKFKSAGIADINPGTIFSCLKKNDFKNIIVCFDNIERRSDNLPLKEILGLINLLKEDKECSVVLILNKNELNKQEDNAKNNMQTSSNDKTQHDAKQNNNDWYQEYKEKVIDYEMLLENNDEIAKALIEEAFMQDEKFIQDDDLKSNLVNIVLKHYKAICNDNLRLLLKILEHIKYFNERCFQSHYDKTIKEEFIIVIHEHYLAIFNAVKDFYIQRKEKRNLSNMYIYDIVTRYLNNFFIINDNDEKKLNDIIIRQLSSELFSTFEKTYTTYFDEGDSDADFKNKIENILQIRDNKLEVFAKDLNSEKFLKTIYWFKQIIKSDQEVSEEYKKGYFEKIDKIIQILIKEQYPYYSKRIKLLIAFSKQYKKFYSKITKKHNNEDKLKIFKYNIEEHSHIFHFVNIDKFNQYEIKSIKDAFYNDKYFLKNFIDFFRLVPKKNPIPKGDYNLGRYTDADSKEYEKIFKKNNLFLAFIEYINENKYKKQMLIKDRRVNNDNSNILSKLFYL
ncbi:NTPase KAP [Campylobacter jejuni]|uniref:P-loop NTPase fold protein n=1 Tax=Campylobacter jejuni TaxID=197 RepID=UPI000F8044F0|nr:P-loop NTPase fold protein [Campylobacter jejuni]EDO9678898.1 NTPase KAP [Campylobacter jejuni]EDP7190297.1 NTPase KAP [Campylobacter jejuni]EDP7204423.1 NTPase KAP [Campylobacter jejuni]HEG3257689.1 NTPase KAP [Campylobacter jejuni]